MVIALSLEFCHGRLHRIPANGLGYPTGGGDDWYRSVAPVSNFAVAGGVGSMTVPAGGDTVRSPQPVNATSNDTTKTWR